MVWNWGSDVRFWGDLLCSGMCENILGKDYRLCPIHWGDCYAWHSAHMVLGLRCIMFSGGMCCRLSVVLICLNLGSGIFKTVDMISRQDFMYAEWFGSKRKLSQLWMWCLRMGGSGCEVNFFICRCGLEVLIARFFHLWGDPLRGENLWYIIIFIL